MTRSAAVLVLLLLVLGAGGAVRGDSRHGAGAGAAGASPSPRPGHAVRDPAPAWPAGSRTVDRRRTVRSPSSDPYRALAYELQARGVRVWYETDLVESWLAGPEPFRRTLARLRVLSRTPGLAGFKIADELGYEDGLTSARQTQRFLAASRAALRRVAPRARVLVDVVVPELGCLGWLHGSVQQVCANEARAEYPAASVAAVTRYLRAGLVDVLDLSTGLLDPEVYRQWGLTRDQAQASAWGHVRRLGWGDEVRLHARKALAAVGGYGGPAQQARADVRTYVTLPTRSGARAVELWTWRQPYDGDVVSLLPDDLRPTPLWAELRRQRRSGVRFWTNMTPSAMPEDLAARRRECDVAARVFSAVLVAAGTG